MYETFEKLRADKKEQIIQVCLEEFVENGYRNASTNTIVKRLGISKGVLFLYFKNKRNLYLYLVEYVMEILTRDYFRTYENVPGIENDVFDHMGQFYKDVIQNKPVIFLFMMQAFINAPEELKEEVEARHNQSHERMAQYISKTGFRQGINFRLVDDLLHMVSYYIGQIIANDLKGKDLNTIINDEINKNLVRYVELFEKYVDIVRYGIYERE